MSVTTSARLNADQLIAALPAGAVLFYSGARLESTAQKEIAAKVDGADVADAALLAAITTAAASFIDRDANRGALAQRAATALQNNKAFLALNDPTAGNNAYLALPTPTNAQVVAQVRALTQQNNALVAQARAITKQVDALIRLALGQVDDVSDT